MAITVEETKTGMSIDWTPGSRAYSTQVRVISDDPIGPRTAALSLGVDVGTFYRWPLYSTPKDWDYGSWLSHVSCQTEGDDAKQYLFTLEFGPYNPKEQAGAKDSDQTWAVNPIDAPPIVRWSSESEPVAVMLDRNAVPILNSAGDPFREPLQKVVSTPVCTITRMLASFAPSWLTEFKDHVNKSDWMGFPAGTVLCKDMTADRVYNNDFGWMWQQTLTLAFRPIIVAESTNPDAPWETDTDVISAGWAVQVLNAGLRQRVPDPDNEGEFLAQQITIDGAPAQSEYCLKKDGTFDPNADPNYLVFDIYDEAEFDGFGLPSDLFSTTAPGSPAGGS